MRRDLLAELRVSGCIRAPWSLGNGVEQVSAQGLATLGV